MRTEKKVCRVCKQEQMCTENPDTSIYDLAYGSNNAGLQFPEHKAPDGTRCEGSGVILQ